MKAQNLLNALECTRELSILLTDNREMRRLNRDFRGKDKTTDVLSFPMPQEDLLGDVVISLPKAREQARLYGVTFQEEFLRLLIHGTLHLLGYEHEKVPRKRAREMQKMEAQLFAGLA